MKQTNNIKLRCGSIVLPNGVEIPMNAQIRKGALGREFYVSGLGETLATIRYIDDGSIKTVTIKQLNA